MEFDPSLVWSICGDPYVTSGDKSQASANLLPFGVILFLKYSWGFLSTTTMIMNARESCTWSPQPEVASTGRHDNVLTLSLWHPKWTLISQPGC